MTACMSFDAHVHIAQEDLPQWLRVIEEDNLAVAVSVTEPAQYLEERPDNIFLSCGLHPWYADKTELESLLSTIIKSDAVGEIGLDNVWCDTPMDKQRAVFHEQLRLASELQLPVVLHTKGCEEEIGETILPFPGPFLVHWYSAKTIYPAYLEKDCYFSIGPDVAINPAVQQVAKTVDTSRFLVETDGIGAVAWATGNKISPRDIPTILNNSIHTIAEIRGIAPDNIEEIEHLHHQTVKNGFNFYGNCL